MIKLFNKINYFYQLTSLAAAPEFNKLKYSPNGQLWFANQFSKSNNDQYFAVLDKSNIAAIKKLDKEGVLPTDNPINFYLTHPKTQALIELILSSYNKYFPNLDSGTVYQHLLNDGTLDPDSGIDISIPIFILIHDLIHQVLQSDFVDSLNQQSEAEENLEPSLLDELNEDIASSLSNFQPHLKNIGQGIWKFLQKTFDLKFTAKNQKPQTVEQLEATLKQIIEETFHYAKAELRGKIDKLVERHTIKSPKIPAKVKQVVDGILSRAKHKMIRQVEDVANEAFDRKIFYGRRIFEMFDLNQVAKEYYERIMDSNIVEQSDSSALRAWMQECLAAMRNLNNYFNYELEQELYGEENLDD